MILCNHISLGFGVTGLKLFLYFIIVICFDILKKLHIYSWTLHLDRNFTSSHNFPLVNVHSHKPFPQPYLLWMIYHLLPFHILHLMSHEILPRNYFLRSHLIMWHYQPLIHLFWIFTWHNFFPYHWFDKFHHTM